MQHICRVNELALIYVETAGIFTQWVGRIWIGDTLVRNPSSDSFLQKKWHMFEEIFEFGRLKRKTANARNTPFYQLRILVFW